MKHPCNYNYISRQKKRINHVVFSQVSPTPTPNYVRSTFLRKVIKRKLKPFAINSLSPNGTDKSYMSHNVANSKQTVVGFRITKEWSDFKNFSTIDRYGMRQKQKERNDSSLKRMHHNLGNKKICAKEDGKRLLVKISRIQINQSYFPL